MPRIAAVDFGKKRIGLAISDPDCRIALPLKMVPAGKDLLASAKNVMAALSSYPIQKILIGMPLMLNGSRGTMAALVDEFIAVLKTLTPVPIEPVDERLTSAQSEKMLKDFYSRKDRKSMVDSTSASIILQMVLDMERFC